MSCYCDAEYPEFYNSRLIIARKKHICYECGMHILKNEQYEHVSGKWNGEIQVYKTCKDCLDLRFILETTKCYCLVHGELFEDFNEKIQDCWKLSYSVKSINHRNKYVVNNIKETYENWKEIKD